MIKEESEPEGSSDALDDALNTLASAALERDSMPLSKKKHQPELRLVNGTPSRIETIEPQWYDVGVIKGTSCVVNSFYLTNATNNHLTTNSDNLPNYTNLRTLDLLPGTAYKFRVAAINSYGRGEWSDVSAFKTCLPGFPGAPCSIRISRLTDGTRLQWDPPTLCSGKIEEYSVCLAIQRGNSSNVSLKDLPFVRVYCGSENNAFVDNESLKSAYIDKTTKPAIIFRIAAKNEKGYGPATQVRWLQDLSPTKNNAEKKGAIKMNEVTKKDIKKNKLSRLGW